MEPTAAVSPNSLPQSSTGRLEVSKVLARSYRRMIISSRSSPAVAGSLRMPKSSMISNATLEIDSMYCLAPALDGRFGDLFQQDMRLAIEHFVALEDRGLPNGLRQMAFTRAGRPRNIMPMVRKP